MHIFDLSRTHPYLAKHQGTFLLSEIDLYDVNGSEWYIFTLHENGTGTLGFFLNVCKFLSLNSANSLTKNMPFSKRTRTCPTAASCVRGHYATAVPAIQMWQTGTVVPETTPGYKIVWIIYITLLLLLRCVQEDPLVSCLSRGLLTYNFSKIQNC